MIVPARSPSEPLYSNKAGNCRQTEPPPGMRASAGRALSLPEFSFFVLDLFYPLCRVQMKC